MKWLCVCFLAALAGCQMYKPMPEEALKERGVLLRSVQVGGKDRKYAVYVPRDYSWDRPWPMIVFLNGSGECGEDGQKQLTVGLMQAVMKDAAAWPFIVVCPQKPNARQQWIEFDDLVMATIAETQKQFNIDQERIYLTGLSQGGAGTWAIGAQHADQFAALAPICGYGELTEAQAKALRDMPLWVFHGAQDNNVLPVKSERLVASVRAAGGNPTFTIFPDANHNSWDAAYQTQKLGDWFLSHRRGTR
jgi:predicted peptidase